MKRNLTTLGLLLSLFFSFSSAWALFGQNQKQPMDPNLAFVVAAKMVDASTLRVEWVIEEGYYLYKDKFSFKTDNPAIILGQAQLPVGKKKVDEFFGEIETYRQHIAIDIPVSGEPAATKRFTLITESQGCADIGICYPPLTQQVEITPSFANSATEKSYGIFDTLKGFGNRIGLGGSNNKFVEPDKAFIASAEAEDAYTITAHWDILDDYYLYREKFEFEIANSDNSKLSAAIQYPPGKWKTDESFGEMETYYNQVTITLPLQRHVAIEEDVTLVVSYQGCADAGLCYPPIEKQFTVRLPESNLPEPSNNQSSSTPVTEQDQIVASLSTNNVLLTLLTFFGFGLLLAFTPCVFPMIPILSSIIVGQGKTITTRRSFIISLTYVLAMAVTYTVAGIVAGLFGENLQATFQNPWILGTFSAVFVLLALSMFGFYELQVPNFIQSRLTNLSNKQKGGTLTGVAVMGFLSALIVGPCVAAPLAGALIYIGQTGDAVLGGMALFALSMGMGAPLLVLGASAGKLLPKAGAWMDTIKAVFGVLLIAVAIWMLERIIPAAIALTLWATLFIISAIYMGALSSVASNWGKLWKGIGLILLVYGVLLLIGAASGSKDMLQPLDHLSASHQPGSNVTRSELTFTTITSLGELKQLKAQAKQSNQFVLVDFYADWCVSCKEMEKYTFADSSVQAALKDVILVKADVTANDENNKALLKEFGIFGPPAILFIKPNGEELTRFRLVGFLKAEAFAKHAKLALSQ